jgi:hypothetical protein
MVLTQNFSRISLWKQQTGQDVLLWVMILVAVHMDKQMTTNSALGSIAYPHMESQHWCCHKLKFGPELVQTWLTIMPTRHQLSPSSCTSATCELR